MRVLLDTNVFVSALLRSVSCRAILTALRDRDFRLVTAEILIDELIKVLSRPKFSGCFSSEDRKNLLDLIEREGSFVMPKAAAVAVRDIKDRPVLGCAYAADVLVTGDHDLQVLERVGETPILSPAVFLARLSRP